MTPSQYLRGQLVGSVATFVEAVGEWSRENRELDREITEARRLFWDSSEGSQRTTAAQRFEHALIKRDIHYVMGRALDSPGGKMPLMALARELSGVHRVDGGISEYCYPTYKAWADEVLSLLGQKVPLEKAVRDTVPLYARYRVERDYTEFLFFNPRSVLRSAAPAVATSGKSARIAIKLVRPSSLRSFPWRAGTNRSVIPQPLMVFSIAWFITLIASRCAVILCARSVKGRTPPVTIQSISMRMRPSAV